MYGNGWGVPKNDAEGVKWYRLAAEQGYDAAQNNLGNMYSDGRGVPQNDAEAVKWYRLAAVQGLASAQYNLGFNYANGLGVPLDYVQAYMWLDLAAGGLLPDDYGAETIALRDRLTSMMTQAQIAKAKKMRNGNRSRFSDHLKHERHEVSNNQRHRDGGRLVGRCGRAAGRPDGARSAVCNATAAPSIEIDLCFFLPTCAPRAAQAWQDLPAASEAGREVDRRPR